MRIEKEEQFKEELRELMKKYEIKVVGHDFYDGHGGCGGTDYYFSNSEFSFNISNLTE